MAYYAIFMQRLANKLEASGFPVVKISPNKRNPKFMVYYFEDTVPFRERLRELLPR